MIYLSGAVTTSLPPSAFSGQQSLGLLLTPAGGQTFALKKAPAIRWAADNGCFAHPERFRLDRYVAWLAALDPFRADCLFITAPDVLGDPQATLERFEESKGALWATGYPLAFIAQDGAENLSLPWDEFDCLFVGGSTAYKLSEAAYGLVSQAKRYGKWCHMGRVNSWRRLRAAAVAGYDSADGNNAAFFPNKKALWLARMMYQLEHQGRMSLPARPSGEQSAR